MSYLLRMAGGLPMTLVSAQPGPQALDLPESNLHPHAQVPGPTTVTNSLLSQTACMCATLSI